MLRKSLLGGCAALALAASAAFGQVNVVPSPGLITGYFGRATYSAGFIGLVPAASATDLTCLAASSSKTVRVVEFRISGSAGTAVALPITVLRRVSLDSGGTAASTTANPANTIAGHDTSVATNASATATPISYTANPTINDTSPVYLDSQSVNLPTTAAGSASVPGTFSPGNYITGNVQTWTLQKGTTQQICVNLNSVSVSSGVINGKWTWTEE